MGQDVLSDNTYFSKIRKLPKLIALSSFQAQALTKNYGIKPELIIPWGMEESKDSRGQRRGK